MSIPMKKQGGGGRYGVAMVSLKPREVQLDDLDTKDRFVFPLIDPKAVLPKNDKSNRATLARVGKSGLVYYPPTNDRPERVVTVYPGTFEYAINGKADTLYDLRPATGSHRVRFTGFARNDPKSPPKLELSKVFREGDIRKMQFDMNFITSDTDSTPCLPARLPFCEYRFFTDQDEQKRDVMNLSLLSNKAKSASLLGQYAMYEEAGIIGRDPETGEQCVLIVVQGPMENYLGAVEKVLLDRLSGREFIMQFQVKQREDGRSKVVVVSLAPDVVIESLSKKRGK